MDAPLFQIGVIADVQYADLDDGNVEGRCQSYREAPAKLEAALADICQHGNPHCVLHLGDIINGGKTEKATKDELELIATIFEKRLVGANIPAVHLIGNHCLATGRKTLMNRLNIPEPGYFTRQLPHDWCLVVLDTTELSGKSDYPSDSWQYKEAREYEKAHPLSEEEPQMSPWNGGISKTQMKWFKNELETATAAGKKVIVACHHQFGFGAARKTHMSWNWKEVQSICLESPSFCLVLAGHDHIGGYAEIAPSGKKYAVTVEGLLEAPTASNAYAILKVFGDRIEIEGKGTVTSRKLSI